MVKVYTRTVCPKCVVAKAVLEENGVEFKTINLEEDEESATLLREKGFMAAPIIEHNDQFFTNVHEFLDSL